MKRIWWRSCIPKEMNIGQPRQLVSQSVSQSITSERERERTGGKAEECFVCILFLVSLHKLLYPFGVAGDTRDHGSLGIAEVVQGLGPDDSRWTIVCREADGTDAMLFLSSYCFMLVCVRACVCAYVIII